VLKRLLDAVSQTARPKVRELPIFPLASVLFPGGVIPLRIFEPRYMGMAKACLKNDMTFGICLIREGSEVGEPAMPEAVGTTARIQEWDMQQLGILQVRATGEGRFRILERHVTESGLITGQVIPIPEDENTAGTEFAQCSDFLRKVLARIGNAHFKGEVRFDDPSWVSFRITEILPISQIIKQKMLELTDARMRLEILHRLLQDKQLIA
jgi:Lon protease-like protein